MKEILDSKYLHCSVCSKKMVRMIEHGRRFWLFKKTTLLCPVCIPDIPQGFKKSYQIFMRNRHPPKTKHSMRK